ncbi:MULTISPECIES: hypothetical protein [unclassified Exiguobacterium]|uniref:hypothetical protein n=1 Tax=unclassified Exiguobacterium TaxID=2644629 RepID=UPI0009FF19FE|nr:MULTISPECIES: hypothetical protein [unclassified Exiguobacterium]TCI72864.1 hypothetical protein EVJ22_00205 [Exiguobacterium sp. SH0S7]
MEKWERWTVNQEIPAKLYLQALIDDKDGLTLVFTDADENNYTFLFDGLVLSYRNTDEGTLFKTLEQLYKNYGPDFFRNWTLFNVTDSNYVKWLAEESTNIYEEIYDIHHYVFLTSNDVIEVLSTDPPSLIS